MPLHGVPAIQPRLFAAPDGVTGAAGGGAEHAAQPGVLHGYDAQAARAAGGYIPFRIEPTRPPTTPVSVASRDCSEGMYCISWCASREMGRVWSQMRPGPVSAARKMPSPPEIILRMPGTREIWKDTVPWNAPTWPGCTRSISPGAR